VLVSGPTYTVDKYGTTYSVTRMPKAVVWRMRRGVALGVLWLLGVLGIQGYHLATVTGPVDGGRIVEAVLLVFGIVIGGHIILRALEVYRAWRPRRSPLPVGVALTSARAGEPVRIGLSNHGWGRVLSLTDFTEPGPGLGPSLVLWRGRHRLGPLSPLGLPASWVSHEALMHALRTAQVRSVQHVNAAFEAVMDCEH
jgi:hypothetical protein